MDAVKIVRLGEEEGRIRSGADTLVLMNGEQIPTKKAVVTFEVDSYVTAELTVAADLGAEVYALPFMSEESFLRAAEHYGYEVKKK